MSQREQAPISQELRAFTDAFTQERESILQFALRVGRELPDDARLLDVGAGDSPYRELFAHLHYETTDWQHSVHPGARVADYVAPAHDLPVADDSYDAVLCTQVLEHVPRPAAVIAEFNRILRPGGKLYLTVPLAWELHEQPFDFFRYTANGLATLLADGGFEQLDIRPRNDCFGTMAQLLRNAASTAGRYPDGRDDERAAAAADLWQMADKMERYVGLDARAVFPLGYSVKATKPGTRGSDVAIPASSIRMVGRECIGLPEARSFVTLCFAADIVCEPYLVRHYAEHFTTHDDATLVVYAPFSDTLAVREFVTALGGPLGTDNATELPHIVDLASVGKVDEACLALAVDAVFAQRPPWGALTGLPWFHSGRLAELHDLAISRNNSGPYCWRDD